MIQTSDPQLLGSHSLGADSKTHEHVENFVKEAYVVYSGV